MIKKLKIKNYKSLKDVELELKKFNVVIGPNASGKSNLLDCLAFISETAQIPINESIARRGGYERVVFGGENQNIELTIDFTLDNELFTYSLSISREGIDKEKLYVGDKIEIDKQKISWAATIYQHSKIREYFNSLRSYNFITSSMRRTDPTKRNLILDKNGGNLAQVLHSLHNERPKTFDKIEDMLKQAIPQIDELLTPLTESSEPYSETYVAVREKGFDSPFNYFQVSDGTLKLLAYITAIASEEANVVCFEEPENFIHPRLFELLVEVLKKSDKQIILSTHSPYLVDWVEPEDVIIVEKKDNETVTSRIKDGDKLKERLAELGLALGEYWYGGGLGGNP